jgi:hypothetical protein
MNGCQADLGLRLGIVTVCLTSNPVKEVAKWLLLHWLNRIPAYIIVLHI